MAANDDDTIVTPVEHRRCRTCGGLITVNVLINTDLPVGPDGEPDLSALNIPEVTSVAPIGPRVCDACGNEDRERGGP